MTLIVGLGNPGKKYAGTRHNIGFNVVEALKEKSNFPDFKFDKKFNGSISEKEGVTLLKPETYMNKSGISIASFSRYYKISPENIVVIHDDVDFLLGKLKVDKGRSSGGHKGVQSIINHLSTKNFWRLRFGVGRKNRKAGEIALQKFSREEEVAVKEMIDKSVSEIISGLEEGFQKKSIKKD